MTLAKPICLLLLLCLLLPCVASAIMCNEPYYGCSQDIACCNQSWAKNATSIQNITYGSPMTVKTEAVSIKVPEAEYPQEYYTLGEQSNTLSKPSGFRIYGFRGEGFNAIYFELRRHTILLERQNELLAEQNELLRNMTARCPA